ncbi:MAG: DMT family transporter [Chloroflexota bacterium]|nr:DMT family transporter [Chloroflexota bacterium]
MSNTTLIAVSVGLVAGAAIALQAGINTLLNRHIGLLESTFISFAVGTLASGIAVLLLGSGSLRKLPEAPLVSLTGGVLGMLVVASVVYTVPRLGVAAAGAVLIVSQFSVAAAMDHFGWFGVERHAMSVWTFVGIALLIAGACVIRR